MFGLLKKLIFGHSNSHEATKAKCDKYAPCFRYVYGARAYSYLECAAKGCCRCLELSQRRPTPPGAE